MPTRYDEDNCHFGCIDCNCYDKDHQNKYEFALNEKYGDDFGNTLTIKAHGLQKFMRCDITELIELYTEKVKELRKLKGL